MDNDRITTAQAERLMDEAASEWERDYNQWCADGKGPMPSLALYRVSVVHSHLLGRLVEGTDRQQRRINELEKTGQELVALCTHCMDYMDAWGVDRVKLAKLAKVIGP